MIETREDLFDLTKVFVDRWNQYGDIDKEEYYKEYNETDFVVDVAHTTDILFIGPMQNE